MALGPEGLLAVARKGSLYVDMSTVRPATSRALAKAGGERGVGVGCGGEGHVGRGVERGLTRRAAVDPRVSQRR